MTMKELRELTRLEGAAAVVRPEDLAKGRTESSMEEIKQQRARKRMDALLEKVSKGEGGFPSVEAAEEAGIPRSVWLRFFLSPVEFVGGGSGGGGGGLSGVRCTVTGLEGAAGAQKAVATGEEEVVPCGMALTSIGYRSEPVPGLGLACWDEWRGVVRQAGGRVTRAVAADGAAAGEQGGDGQEPESHPAEQGLYCAGWLKRGPTGIIGTNIPDAKQTAGAVLEDWSEGRLGNNEEKGARLGALRQRLEGGMVTSDSQGSGFVDWNGWGRIDAAEAAAGEPQGRPRVKITSIPEMLRVAGQ